MQSLDVDVGVFMSIYGILFSDTIKSLGQAFSFYWHWGPDNSLLQGIVLCTVECLAASTASTHQMPIEIFPLVPLPYLPQV